MTGNGQGVRIALDARPLVTSRAGVATYCRDLVRGYGLLADDERFVLYAKNSPPADLSLGPAFQWRTMPAPLWLPLAVPRALQAGRVHLFHGTNHMAPVVAPTPTVITVHDISVLTMPYNHTWRNRLLTAPQMLLSLHRAKRLITDSTFTARDLMRHVPGIDPARIRVIPLARNPDLAPATPTAVRELAQRMKLPPTFFLFLGALGPNKNVATLLRAVKQLQTAGDERAQLVIAGAEGSHRADVHREVRRLGLEEVVRFVGYVDTHDLPALYGAATAFIFPSLFEGFGLPPLEAMACGAPVICSNAAALPEVVGDAALLFDPRAEDELVRAMRSMLDREDLRARLRSAGLARSTLFSLERFTRQTLEVYHEAIGEQALVRLTQAAS